MYRLHHGARSTRRAVPADGPDRRSGVFEAAATHIRPSEPVPVNVRRLAFLLLLCVAAGALVVGFGAQFNGTDAYPDATAIAAEYDEHVGETVHLWGEVTAIEDGTVVVSAGTLSLRVTDPPSELVVVGDQIQMYGTLGRDHRFETAAYHIQTPEELRDMYVVSIAGIVLAAGAFLRRWRLDTGQVAFVPREGR
jgi:hypothetical protein